MEVDCITHKRDDENNHSNDNDYAEMAVVIVILLYCYDNEIITEMIR